MTITRIHQESFELVGIEIDNFEPWFSIDTPPGGSLDEYTGAYGLGFASLSEGIGMYLGPAIAQMRAGMMFKCDGTASGGSGLFFLCSGSLSTIVLNVYYDGATDTWYVYAGATQLGTFVYDVEDNTYRHIGIDFLSHASTGWCYVYIDGVAQLSYTGQTNQGASTFNLAGLGPVSNTYDGWNPLVIDDFYIDNSTGEVSPQPVAKKRFYPLEADGTGNYAQWYGNDGDQVDNYALVNSSAAPSTIRSNGMLQSATSGHRDSWTLGATPAGVTDDNVVAVIVGAWADARSISAQMRAFLRLSSTDLDGDAKYPGLFNRQTWQRFTTKPGGGAWTKSDVDAAEMGIKFE